MTGPLCILGPTASGKSTVALAIAQAVPDVELVSIDSMQVYRGMDIGTAKPTPDERERVRHHLIDLVDPSEAYTVSRFQETWHDVHADIEARGKVPVLVGGTGLYLRAIIDDLDIPGQYPEVREQLDAEGASLAVLYARLQDMDPVAASRIDPGNARRIVRAIEVTIGSGRMFSDYGPGLEDYPATPFQLFGLRLERDVLDRRIDARYDQQMRGGFLEEVRALAAAPDGISFTARQALGYRELLRHVEGGEPLDLMLDEAKLRTRRFARRQQKWFGRDPRIEWVDLPVDADGISVDHGPAVERAIELVR